jgi:hypothetical protein
MFFKKNLLARGQKLAQNSRNEKKPFGAKNLGFAVRPLPQIVEIQSAIGWRLPWYRIIYEILWDSIGFLRIL